MEQLLQVGVITSTHGLKGEVKVFPTTDYPERFEEIKEVLLDTGRTKMPIHIKSVRYFKNLVILKFKEFDNINDVEKYKQDYVYHEGYREEYTYRIVEGFHNTIDGKKGFAWYRKANSRYRLACCYYEGVGTEKNWAKAVEIFQSYANSTEFEHYAANALCHCYSTGGYGVEKNFLKAARWLLKL